MKYLLRIGFEVGFEEGFEAAAKEFNPFHEEPTDENQ